MSQPRIAIRPRLLADGKRGFTAMDAQQDPNIQVYLQINKRHITHDLNRNFYILDDNAPLYLELESAYRQQIYDQMRGAAHGPHRFPNQTVHVDPTTASGTSAGTQSIAAAYNTITHAVANKSIPREGVRAGEIVAYRAWNYVSWRSIMGRTYGKLASMFAMYTWEPGQIVEGDVEIHGVHAFKKLDQAISEYRLAASDSMPVIFGSVYLWGEVVEHDRGYRAQYAEIKELMQIRTHPALSADDDRMGRTLQILKKLYEPKDDAASRAA